MREGPVSHHTHSKVSKEELCELDGTLLDKDWSSQTFDRVDVDVISGQDAIAKFRTGVFDEAEIEAAWEAFPARPDSLSALKVIRAIDHLFSAHAIDWYSGQAKLIDKYKPRHIENTCFTSICSYPGNHAELRRHPGCLVFMPLTMGLCEGGPPLVMLPEYSCGFVVHTGDLLMLAPDEWLAESHIEKYTNNYRRVTIEFDSYVFEDESQLRGVFHDL